MHSATINQLSNTIRRGDFGFPTAPLVLGNEGAVIVEESDRFARGTRVAVYGRSDLGVSVDGPFQQWALAWDDRLLQLPDGLDWAEGAVLTVNYLTAYLALTKTAKVRSGQTVLVSGATDSLGHAVMQTARALGARPIALVSSAHKARRAAGGRSVGGAVVERAWTSRPTEVRSENIRCLPVNAALPATVPTGRQPVPTYVRGTGLVSSLGRTHQRFIRSATWGAGRPIDESLERQKFESHTRRPWVGWMNHTNGSPPPAEQGREG
ncbi:hypothetical protein [Streptomyces mirabilis]|uniref:hypothetical protein n=1 Tax=Streptomyces mirabilis TaxID=68239 RepID=UPI0036D95CC6